MKELAGILPS